MPRLSQETLAILGVGIGIAALILTTTAGLRAEMRAEFHSVRTEARADRETFQAHTLRLTEHSDSCASVASLNIPKLRNAPIFGPRW